MTGLSAWQGEQIKGQIAGKEINGVLIDVGKDFMVLYNGEQYLYIPLVHIHQLQKNDSQDEYVQLPTVSSNAKEMGTLSFQEVLTNAKDIPVEIYISNYISFHGYITDILDDYFAFYTPIYKVVYIPFRHFKWLIPYSQNTVLYTVKNNDPTGKNTLSHPPVNLTNNPLQPSLEAQLKNEAGGLIIFDGGTDLARTGLLKNAANNFAELVLASGETTCLNLSHVKCVQLI